MKKLIIFTLAIFGSYHCSFYAQNKSLQIGLRLMGELTLYDGLAPGAGVQGIYTIGKHGALETGVQWQKRRFTSIYTEGPGGVPIFYYSEIYSHRLQFPVLYRYYSKAINFSFGPVIDFPIGISVKTKDPDPALKNFKNYSTQIIATGSISRSFYLSPVWILEPEVAFNYLTVRNDGGLGLNLSFRKKIF